MRQRVEFKQAVLMFKVLNGFALPPYLSDDYRLVSATSRGQLGLRTASVQTCVLQRKSTTNLVDWAFSPAGQRLWNILPAELWQTTTNNKQTRTIKVSEMSLHRHYKSRSHGKDCLKRKVTLQAATVDRRRWSGGDMTRQTVPDTGSSDRKCSVADRRQPCTANEQWRCWTKPCPVVRSAGWRNLSARYDGAIPLRHL